MNLSFSKTVILSAIIIFTSGVYYAEAVPLLGCDSEFNGTCVRGGEYRNCFPQDSPCNTVILPVRSRCFNDKCTPFNEDGENQCKTDDDCVPHFICETGGICTAKTGVVSEDQCRTDDDCIAELPLVNLQNPFSVIESQFNSFLAALVAFSLAAFIFIKIL